MEGRQIIMVISTGQKALAGFRVSLQLSILDPSGSLEADLFDC